MKMDIDLWRKSILLIIYSIQQLSFNLTKKYKAIFLKLI